MRLTFVGGGGLWGLLTQGVILLDYVTFGYPVVSGLHLFFIAIAWVAVNEDVWRDSS